MEQSDEAKRFLANLDPEALKVGDGSDGLPVWIGIDAEAQKVYKVYASGLAVGFGDGLLINRVGVGLRAGAAVEQSTIGSHVMLDIGQGAIGRRMEILELLG